MCEKYTFLNLKDVSRILANNSIIITNIFNVNRYYKFEHIHRDILKSLLFYLLLK